MCECAKVIDGVKESARASRLEIEFQPLHPIGVSEVRVRGSWHRIQILRVSVMASFGTQVHILLV